MAKSNPQEVADDLVADNGNVTRALAVVMATMKRDPNPLWEQVRSELTLRKNRGEKAFDPQGDDDMGDEPVGAQALRCLHTDGTALLEEYDGFLKIVEQEDVKDLIQTQLERLEEGLTNIEELFAEKYPEQAPLEGAMDPESSEDDLEEDDGTAELQAKYGGKAWELPDRYGMQENHRNKIAGAKAFIEEISKKQDRFTDEDRQKAYHHARNLELVRDDLNDDGPLGGKSVGYEDLDEDVQTVEKAAKFLKELTTTRNLDYSHRSRAKSHIQPLNDLTDDEIKGEKSLARKIAVLNGKMSQLDYVTRSIGL